jgi:transposase
MTMRRYALRNDQWERIKDLLPGREKTVGVTAKDNRLFVEAVLYRYRAGITWRDLPERFGDWKNTKFKPSYRPKPIESNNENMI